MTDRRKPPYYTRLRDKPPSPTTQRACLRFAGVDAAQFAGTPPFYTITDLLTADQHEAYMSKDYLANVGDVVAYVAGYGGTMMVVGPLCGGSYVPGDVTPPDPSRETNAVSKYTVGENGTLYGYGAPPNDVSSMWAVAATEDWWWVSDGGSSGVYRLAPFTMVNQGTGTDGTEYYTWDNPNSFGTYGLASDGTSVYIVEWEGPTLDTTDIIKIDDATLTKTVIGTVNEGLQHITWYNGKLYGVTWSSTPNPGLYEIDPTDASATLIDALPATDAFVSSSTLGVIVTVGNNMYAYHDLPNDTRTTIDTNAEAGGSPIINSDTGEMYYQDDALDSFKANIASPHSSTSDTTIDPITLLQQVHFHGDSLYGLQSYNLIYVEATEQIWDFGTSVL